MGDKCPEYGVEFRGSHFQSDNQVKELVREVTEVLIDFGVIQLAFCYDSELQIILSCGDMKDLREIGFQDKVSKPLREFFKKLPSFTNGGHLLVAVSGGADSICLLHGLQSIGFQLSAAHINYNLREESSSEEELVRVTCKELNIPLYIRSSSKEEIDETEGSLQMAAREIRYGFFEELLRSHNIPYCATAHHQGDQVETILLSLLRGGTSGTLNAIPSSNGFYLRPLLEVSRSDIEAYNAHHNLSYGIDSSNEKRDYLRNQIRLDIIPLLKAVNPSIVNRLLEFQEDLLLRDRYIRESFSELKGVYKGQEGGTRIVFDELNLPEKNWPLLLDQLMREVGFSGTQIKSAQNLLDSISGKELVWQDGSVLRDQKGILIRKEKIRNEYLERIHIKPSEISLTSIAPGGNCLDVGTWSVNFQLQQIDTEFTIPTVEGVYCLDAGKVRFPLRVRGWKEGDRMQPFGMNGRKKLSDIFTDQKLSLEEKIHQLVLEDQNGIVLLGGYRIDEGVRLDKNSQRALIVGIEKIDFKSGNDDVQEPEDSEN